MRTNVGVFPTHSAVPLVYFPPISQIYMYTWEYSVVGILHQWGNKKHVCFSSTINIIMALFTLGWRNFRHSLINYFSPDIPEPLSSLLDQSFGSQRAPSLLSPPWSSLKLKKPFTFKSGFSKKAFDKKWQAIESTYFVSSFLPFYFGIKHLMGGNALPIPHGTC